MSSDTPRQRVRVSTTIGQLDGLALDLAAGTSYHELAEYLKNHELIPLAEVQALGLGSGPTTPGMHEALLLRRDQVVLVELLEPRDDEPSSLLDV